MIMDKVFSSFFIVELTGKSMECITNLSDRCGIQKIIIKTQEFPTDIHATKNADASLSLVLKSMKISQSAVNIKEDLNPDFFPYLYSEESSANNENELDEMADDIIAKLIKQNKMVAPLTTIFDPLGDCVITRKTVTSDSFCVTIKVIANVKQYLRSKSFELVQKANSNLSFKLLKKSSSIH